MTPDMGNMTPMGGGAEGRIRKLMEGQPRAQDHSEQSQGAATSMNPATYRRQIEHRLREIRGDLTRPSGLDKSRLEQIAREYDLLAPQAGYPPLDWRRWPALRRG